MPHPKATRFLPRFFLLLLLAHFSAKGEGACYWPNGDLAEGVPCSDSHTSICCRRDNEKCLPNKLCQRTNESPLAFYRPSCTDQTFESPDCFDKCKECGGGASVRLWECDSADHANHSWCFDKPEMGANCCNTPSQLLFLDQIASAASSISPISSPSSSAPPTTPSRTAPTARPASANNKTRVAIGAGIGSFVAVAGGIGAYFLCRRRRKKQQKTKKAPAPVPMNIILTAPTHYAPSTVSTSESRDLSNLPNLSSPRPYADSSVSTYAPSLTFDEIGVPPFPEALHDDEVDIASIPASAHDDDTEALITQELDLESFPERPPLPPLPSRSP